MLLRSFRFSDSHHSHIHHFLSYTRLTLTHCPFSPTTKSLSRSRLMPKPTPPTRKPTTTRHKILSSQFESESGVHTLDDEHTHGGDDTHVSVRDTSGEETMQIRTESIQIKTTELELESDSEAAAIWNEIEASESFLVCSMYQEAALAASSILERLRHGSLATPDMLESTAMVLLQALIHLPRTQHILDQLRLHFISVKAIPPRVLLTGACFQIAQGSGLGVQEFVEDFLNGWSLEDARYCAIIKETNVEDGSIKERHIVLEINEYVEVVELYSVTLLATVRKDVDLAISWVENSSLPEENRQGLLRRLRSMHSPESTILSQPFPQSPTNRNEDYSLKERNMSEGLPQAFKTKHINNEKDRSKNALIKLSKQIETCFCCFRGIHLKIGSTKFVITSGKIMLGCLLVFIYYVFRRKQATIKRILRRQAISVKRALVDLWQLAFSYQVNPLAAVQPPSAASRQGQ